ncbi:unnamed protein product [Gongylonema pulchrum]|uniref:Uncharacterized protein n=1 Tax=Gongylonema pulchrum TaxID=637853 RepID=A0A183DHK2_9BILA|nr:unnamed protein product [Gongylonema pulchrum]
MVRHEVCRRSHFRFLKCCINENMAFQSSKVTRIAVAAITPPQYFSQHTAVIRLYMPISYVCSQNPAILDGNRNGTCITDITRRDSFRSRTYSVSPERALSLPREATPHYVRYLKEQNELGKLPARLLF